MKPLFRFDVEGQVYKISDGHFVDTPVRQETALTLESKRQAVPTRATPRGLGGIIY